VLTFAAVADGDELTARPAARWRAGDGTYLERWESPLAEVERLTCTIAPDLPVGMAVEECWAVLWRFVALSEIQRFEASGRLARGPRVSPGSGDSGQYLHALQFEGDGWHLHIGTEDDEALQLRSAEGQLPTRWHELPLVSYGRLGLLSRLAAWLGRPHVEPLFDMDFDEERLIVGLPPLVPGDRGELQFVAAWHRPRDAHDVSSWYAVERPTDEILRQAACR
jgi:hypothetical protein